MRNEDQIVELNDAELDQVAGGLDGHGGNTGTEG